MSQKKYKIPSYLETPPSPPKIISPPTTNLQELPFEEIRWESFEKLCLRLARNQSIIEFCRLYGEPGDEQGGIDLYARSKGREKYIVYQCKREKKFGPKKIKTAIDKFLKGGWSDKTETFVLCTSEPLRSKMRADEIERQRKKLHSKGIKLEVWDKEELSIILKTLPEIVNDFFGKSFVELFNGLEVSEKIKKRLDVEELAKLRALLKSLYEIVFNQHDPGIPTFGISNAERIPLTKRFIEPDIYEERQLNTFHATDKVQLENEESFERINNYSQTQKRNQNRNENANYKQRISLSEWVGKNNRYVVLGDPGSGKSTFLRYLALDLLSAKPSLVNVSQKWGGHIPVWLPFGLWTKIIQESPNSKCSVSDLLKKWLSDWDEDRIWPLMEQALEDERLLLLVDGMDEWTNENSGVIAVQRLQVFVKQRNIPAIITSRPHGYKMLQFQDFEWHIGKLAEFSKGQQRALINLWFKLWNSRTSHKYQSSQSEIDNFMNELQRVSDLQDLAKIPLLLSLLITLKIQNARLPANRFLAYDKLVELLITTHPKRRRQAMALKDNLIQKLSTEELKDILSHLASYILETHSEGVIEIPNAIKITELFLKDEEHGLGFSNREAKKLSREFLDIGQGELGIIVQVSQNDISFFHRTLLQYLAANHIVQLSDERQEEIILSNCTNLQWYETILALFYLTRQKNVIKQFINKIGEKEVEIIDNRTIQLLLSEVAFGEFNCPPSLTDKLSKEVLDEIEFGSWMPHRVRLLNRTLNGLQSSRTRKQVEEKVFEWFPSRSRFRPSLYEAMSNWPADENTFECLWRGLHDEEITNKRAAGKILSQLYSSNNDVYNKVIRLATSDSNIDIIAAAIETLILGWPKAKETKNIVEKARQSLSPSLNLIGIYGTIKSKKIDSKLEDETFNLFEKYLEHDWNDILVQIMLEGWSKSDKIKHFALNSLNHYRFQSGGMNRDIAYPILLAGYPGDQDVVDFCVREINTGEFPFNTLFKENIWRLLEKNFKKESKIVEAVENNRSKFVHDPISLSFSALIGETEEDKKALINYYKEKSFPFWAASALLQGWGIHDEEVRTLLEKDVWGEAKRASQIGHLFPEIILDRNKCRKRLLEILNSGKIIRYDFVTEGLIAISDEGNEDEIVTSLVKLIQKKDISSSYLDTAKEKLIINFSKYEKVEEIAQSEFDNRKGSLTAIAIGFSNVERFRIQIAKLSNPLPRLLREIIIDRLSEDLGEITFREEILSRYDFETDASIKTQASIAYHRFLVARDSVEQSNLDYLKETIMCYGSDFPERRQAAFCGLIALKKLDIIFDVQEAIGDDKKVKISIDDYSKTNVPLLNEILNNWDYLNEIFGNDLIPRIGKNSNDHRVWESLSLIADSYPKPRDEIIKYIKQTPESYSSLIFINFVARVLPKSKLLLSLCLENISNEVKGYGIYHEDKFFDVSNILASHFQDDKHIFKELLSKEMNTRIFFALLQGWSASIDIDTLLDQNKDKISHNGIIDSHLVSKKENSDSIIEWMEQLLNNPITPYVLRTSLFWKPIIKRMREDAEIWEHCFITLTNTKNLHLKVSLSHLIYKSSVLEHKFREWGIHQINNQLNNETVSDVGFDLLSGDYRPLSHILYQAFDSEIDENLSF